MKPSKMLALAAASLAAACTVGPDHVRPNTPRPLDLTSPAAVESGAAIRLTAAPVVDRWWETFRDPELDRLIARARAGNPGLLAALARVQAARAVGRQARAPLLPTLSATHAYSYAQQSEAGSGLGDLAPSSPLFDGTDVFQGGTDMSYEVDLWGRLRRTAEAADAELQATDEDRKSVELSLTADVAQAYFDLGEAEARAALVHDAVATRERTLGLVRARRRVGVATDLDVSRAEGELAAARASQPDARRERALARHRLALLLGRTPDLDFDGKAPAAFAVPGEVPLGLPAALLERRPDVRRAEQQLIAANARIGAKKAELYPRLTLVGHLGYSALDAKDVGHPAAQAFSAGPQLTIPIFEAGRLQAAVVEAEAKTLEALMRHRETVLRAFREVADAAASVDLRRSARDREAEAVAADQRTLALATAQLERGLIDTLELLDAERQLLRSRTALLRAQRELLGELVRLHEALGGGWTELPAEEEG